MVYCSYPEQNGAAFTFKRGFRNYANALYFTESEKLIDRVVRQFGFLEFKELEKKKKEFVHEVTETDFVWNFKGGQTRLEKDPDSMRPTLTFLVTFNKEPDICD